MMTQQLPGDHETAGKALTSPSEMNGDSPPGNTGTVFHKISSDHSQNSDAENGSPSKSSRSAEAATAMSSSCPAASSFPSSSSACASASASAPSTSAASVSAASASASGNGTDPYIPGSAESVQYQKWKRMMQRGIEPFIAQHPDTFQRRVRRGIPAEFRWEVWKAAVRFEDARSSAPKGTYQRLHERENRWSHLISIDISRTFPEHADFNEDLQAALWRILNAYANLNRDVGYCQGMNFIAGLLLLVSKSEDETFWMFVRLMEDGKLNGFYKEKFPLLRLYLRAFDQLVAETIPELREHFIAENVQPAVYLHQWFLTLFINCLPLPTVLIIWDVIVCDGLPVIMSITVSLLKVLKNVLMNMHFEDIVKFFKTMKAGDEECDATMIGQLLIKQSNRIDIPPHILQQLQTPEKHVDEDRFNDNWEPAMISPMESDVASGSSSSFGAYLRGLGADMSSWWGTSSGSAEGTGRSKRSDSFFEDAFYSGGETPKNNSQSSGGYRHSIA